MEHPLDQFKSAVRAMSPHNLLPPPSPVTGWVSVGRRENLDIVQALFNNSQTTGVLLTVLATNANHSTVWAAMRKVNSIPARPNTVFMVARLRLPPAL